MAAGNDSFNSGLRRKVILFLNTGEVNDIINDEKALNQEGFQLNKELLELWEDMLEFKNY
jgi:hypothetical protein